MMKYTEPTVEKLVLKTETVMSAESGAIGGNQGVTSGNADED